MKPSKQQFIAIVMMALPKILDPRSMESVSQNASELYEEGFTTHDAIAYLNCREEVSPTLDEETALERMRTIRAKYPFPFSRAEE